MFEFCVYVSHSLHTYGYFDILWVYDCRYFWSEDDLYIRAVNAEFLYGYEYLGNSGRLVITPLTDR